MVALRRRVKTNNFLQYQNGGEGFIKWVEDYEVAIEVYVGGLPTFVPMVRMSKDINPETGRNSWQMWEEMKRIAREALVMKDGKFVHRLIVFCWMRGEGKSLFVCLILLWKFFCFPSQKLMLCANSKDQSKFVHYDIVTAIIRNSPRLLAIIGEKNILDKQISLKNKRGNIVSFIRSISSFSGIVSNITGYTFSEIFDMKKPRFFTQIDGSIRNVPNAFGLIDSTVAPKDHILYQLYKSYTNGLDPTLYFSHRESRNANSKDFWNPYMTEKQIRSYETKFPAQEFDQYFKNTWESASLKLFTPELVESIQYIGIDKTLGEHNQVMRIIENAHRIRSNENLPDSVKLERERSQTERLIHINSVYSLRNSHSGSRMIDIDEIDYLTSLYDTNWALCVGIDRADPMKKDITKGAKTQIVAVLKGLPGSKSNPITMNYDNDKNRYVYFLAYLYNVVFNDIETIKTVVEDLHLTLGGVNTLCTERWGMWDIGDWCDSLDIGFDPITAVYQRQMEIFSELFIIWKSGRFKAPLTGVPGVKNDDILIEEASIFDNNKDKKYYGSPEKEEFNGIQDDVMFALGNAIYGGRFLNPDHFIERSVRMNFGTFVPNKGLIGRYDNAV